MDKLTFQDALDVYDSGVAQGEAPGSITAMLSKPDNFARFDPEAQDKIRRLTAPDADIDDMMFTMRQEMDAPVPTTAPGGAPAPAGIDEPIPEVAKYMLGAAGTAIGVPAALKFAPQVSRAIQALPILKASPVVADFLAKIGAVHTGAATGFGAGMAAPELISEEGMTVEKAGQIKDRALKVGMATAIPEGFGSLWNMLVGTGVPQTVSRAIVEAVSGLTAEGALAEKPLSEKEMGVSFLSNLLGGLFGGMGESAAVRSAAAAPYEQAGMPKTARVMGAMDDITSAQKYGATAPAEAIADVYDEVGSFITGRPLKTRAEIQDYIVEVTDNFTKLDEASLAKISSGAGLTREATDQLVGNLAQSSGKPIYAKELLGRLDEMKSEPRAKRLAMQQLGPQKEWTDVGSEYMDTTIQAAKMREKRGSDFYGAYKESVPEEAIVPGSETKKFGNAVESLIETHMDKELPVAERVLGSERKAADQILEMANEEFGGFNPRTPEEQKTMVEKMNDILAVVYQAKSGNPIPVKRMMQVYRDLNLMPVKNIQQAKAAHASLKKIVDNAIEIGLQEYPGMYKKWRQANQLVFEGKRAMQSLGNMYDPMKASLTTSAEQAGTMLRESMGARPGTVEAQRADYVGVADRDRLKKLYRMGVTADIAKKADIVDAKTTLKMLKEANQADPTAGRANAIGILENFLEKKPMAESFTATMINKHAPNTVDAMRANQDAEKLLLDLQAGGDKVVREMNVSLLAEFTDSIRNTDGSIDVNKAMDFATRNPVIMTQTDAGDIIKKFNDSMTGNAGPAALAEVAATFRKSEFKDLLGVLASKNKNRPEVWKSAFAQLQDAIPAQDYIKIRQNVADGLLSEMAHATVGESGDVISRLQSYANNLVDINDDMIEVFFGYDPRVVKKFKIAQDLFPRIAPALDAVQKGGVDPMVVGRRGMSMLTPFAPGDATAKTTLSAAVVGFLVAGGPKTMMNMALSPKLPQYVRALETLARTIRRGRIGYSEYRKLEPRDATISAPKPPTTEEGMAP